MSNARKPLKSKIAKQKSSALTSAATAKPLKLKVDNTGLKPVGVV